MALDNRPASVILLAIITSCIISVVSPEKLPLEDKNSPFSSSSMNSAEATSKQPKGDLGLLHAFVASLSVIVVSELGDKTFFIAAIMAMRHPRLTVFAGAISALALMTVLSVMFGYAATIIPRAYTYYISTALFALFGLKMLRDGYYMSPNEAQEELEEVQLDLRKREDEYEKEATATIVQDPETGVIRKATKSSVWLLVSRVFIQAFTLTFLAEWGDRSQLTTIILAAREDVYGVTLGGVLGHSFCTGLAVLGGRMIAQKISVRTVTIIGGVVFLLFAITALFVNPTQDV
ncbi:transmembrane protein 165 [Athalia rosae]|uniref:transmembrane protein 165 n=1 Tax=Athalia rosae TaxID=37344 RepID=UPI000626DC06|nr:transmembrane protein 165 [Athalia rosae]